MAKPSPRLVGFAILCVVCVSISAFYIVRARNQVDPNTGLSIYPRESSQTEAVPLAAKSAEPASGGIANPLNKVPAIQTPSNSSDSKGLGASEKSETIPTSAKGTHLVFRSTALDDSFGRIGVVPLDSLTGPRSLTSLRCERVHLAAGRGVCLAADRGVFTTFSAVIFDSNFNRQQQISLGGIPSRVRVAPNGQVAAITVFISGHSYASANFSTLTTFVDMNTGELLVDNMEKFRVSRGSERLQAADFNFWGVTFAHDSRRFYATLASGGQIYLIEGDLSKMEARVLRNDVECPSISPDNTRIGFKKRTGGAFTPVSWRLSVLDIKSLDEWPSAETRSVDDQVEWLDNDNLLYALPEAATSTPVTNAWSVAATGKGESKQILPKAYSPVVFFK